MHIFKIGLRKRKTPKEEYRGFTLDGHEYDPHGHFLACTIPTQEREIEVEKSVKLKS